MRQFLNAILMFVGSSSLTDEEFDSIEVEIEPQTYDQLTYDTVSNVLKSREAVSTIQDRLVSFFTAKGVEVVPATTGSSNIFLGSVL